MRSITRQEDRVGTLCSSGGSTWLELNLVSASSSLPSRSPLIPSLVARAAQGGQAHGMVNKWAAAAGQVRVGNGQGNHRPRQATTGSQPLPAAASKSRVPLHFPTAHFLLRLPSTSGGRVLQVTGHPPCPSRFSKSLYYSLPKPPRTCLASPCLPLHFPKLRLSVLFRCRRADGMKLFRAIIVP